jgi:hypothetical protein
MTRGFKSTGYADINKGGMQISCGAIFIGTPKLIVLKERLHKKKCDYCKQHNSKVTKPSELMPDTGIMKKVSGWADHSKHNKGVVTDMA